MNHKTVPFWTMSFLVTSNLLGVGILALPVKTGLSGALPTLIATIGIWAMMTYTSLVIAKRLKFTADSPQHFDIPTFYKNEVGTIGKWIAIFANLLLLYGVLTAYLSMISTMINALFHTQLPESVFTFLYFLIATSFTVFGFKMLQRSTVFVLVCVWTCFFILLIYAFSEFDINRLTTTNWKFLPAGLGVLVSAFHFHNIVPTVCKRLKNDYGTIRKAIITGTSIGLIMNLAWAFMVIGGLPFMSHLHYSLLSAYQHNEPATVPLSEEIQSHVFTLVGLVFALFSVTASYVANGTGLQGFLRDILYDYFKISNKKIIALCTFLPPLLITLINPNIFLAAVDMVGGIGETILFGILPGYIVVKYARGGKEEKPAMIWVGALVFGVASFIFLYQSGVSLDLIHPTP